jgi:hypothetical protein
MRTRLLVLVPLVAVVLAGTAQAAPTKVPQIQDPTGDGVQPGIDLVSVLYTTVGKGTGKAYTPRSLVVTMTLAGPVMTEPGLTYEVEAATTTCGDVTFTMEPGTPYESLTGLNGWVDWGTCTVGDSNVELLTVKVKDSTIVWTYGIKASPLELGTVFSDFRARIDPSNPVVPFPSSATGTELGLLEAGTGSGTWKLG